MLKGWNDAPKASLTIRMLIGAYLLYIDYQIFGDVMAREGASKIVMIAFMVFFAITGVFLVAMSAKALLGAGEGNAPKDGKEGREPDSREGSETDNEEKAD